MKLRVTPLLLAVPLLGFARLLPGTDLGLWLRLVAASLVLLLPGRLLARALGGRGPAEAVAWSIALVAGALALTFAVGASLDLTLALVLAAGAVALPFAGRARESASDRRGRGLAAIVGAVMGLAIWPVEGIVRGDALFHLGRIRKLDDFSSLSLRAVDEFKDGGLHPGYAFPLWHAWLALVTKLAGVDPTAVVLHESSVLAPLALVLAYEMGRQVFRSAWMGLATALATVTMMALASGAGGSYTSLELPGTVARQLLVPVVIALFFRFVRGPTWTLAATLAAAGMDLAFIHPTYALFVAIPLVGYALTRLLVVRDDLRRNVAGLAAFGAPVLLVFAWLAPIVRETLSHDPHVQELARALEQYAADLVVYSPTSYHLAPGNVARTGSVAVAALVLVPLAVFAARRRWSALVLGGTVLVVAIELSSFVFPHFSDLVSLSQSRRAAGFVPFAFALAGGAAVLTRALGRLLLPVALAAGIVLELEFKGNFDLRPVHAGPAPPTWIALFGGVAALAAVLLVRRVGRGRYERPGPLATAAVCLFVLPVGLHGIASWNAPPPVDRNRLSRGLLHFLRTDVPERAVVYADPETSYQISAYVPVYVADAPPTHVADTKANRPYLRRRDAVRFFRTGDQSIPRSYGAGWIVARRGERVGRGHLLLYFRDRRYRVYRLVPSSP